MSGPGGSEKPAGGRRFGKYLLHDRLAVGGMGELHLATEVGATRGTPPCVLKILLPEYSNDAEFVSMFHDEARIGLQLRHGNIVGVYDLGRVQDTPYLALEYVHGENLRTVLNRVQDKGETFPVEHAVYVVIEALQGLSYAHHVKDARGRPLNLVHRDLSPDNIMVTFDGDVKVLDFGIAKAEGRATQTQFGILKGKVQYMSPEQALGWAVDARTDVYAMGLVLLEVLTGERRFENIVDPVQMIRDARTWVPKPPSSHDKALTSEVDALVLKALQSSIDKRFQGADEFAAALIRVRRSGTLPRPKENLPAMMRRLFPDRAEPFLQVDPSYRRPTSSGEISIPDEAELLGTFLARGPQPSSNPRIDEGAEHRTADRANDERAERARSRGEGSRTADRAIVSERTRESDRMPEITAPGARDRDRIASERTVAAAPLTNPTLESSLGEATVVGAPPVSDAHVPAEITAPGARDGTVVEPRRETSREIQAAKKREVSREVAARREPSRESPAARREVSRDGIPAAKRKAVAQEAPPADETTAAGAPRPSESQVAPLAKRGSGTGLAILLGAVLVAGGAGFAIVAFEDQLPLPMREALAPVLGAVPKATATPEATPTSLEEATPEATPELTPEEEDDDGPAAGGGRFPGAR